MTQWTTEKPSGPGWYWWRERYNFEAVPEMAEVYSLRDKLRVKFHSRKLYLFVDKADGEWQGPIVPEEEGA